MRTVLLTTEGTRFAGIEANLLNLIKANNELRLVDYRLAVFDEGPLAEQAREAGLEVTRIKRRGKYDRGAIKQLAAVVESTGSNVVHAHGYLANVVAARACRKKQVPLVTTVHGLPEPFRGLANWKMRFNLWLDRRAMRRTCAKVIAVASFIGEGIIERGMPAEKVVVVHNGIVDLVPDPALRVPNRRTLDLLPDSPAIAFAGRLEPVKDPLLFVEFARLVLQRLPSARFLVVGDGPLSEAMNNRVIELGLRPAFRFLGFVENLEPVYAACDLLALTSQSEGLPNVALEAMRAARPVIAPAIGGLPELLGDLSGMLATERSAQALADLAVALLRDRQQAVEAGKNARECFLTGFTAEHMMRAMDDVYRSVTAEDA